MKTLRSVVLALMFGVSVATGCKTSGTLTDYPFEKPEDLEEVVMEVDTSYSSMPAIQKEISSDAYEIAKDFLNDKGIQLRVREDAELGVRFSNVGEFVARYFLDETRFPPSRNESSEETLYEDARDELFFYTRILSLKDTLNVNGEMFTEEKEKLRAALEVTMTGGAYFSDDRLAMVNVPSKIYAAGSISDSGVEVSPEGLVANVFLHELGHSVGLVHPSAFVNLDTSISQENIMTGYLGEDYELSDLQVRLWKEGLTQGTKLNHAIKMESISQDPVHLVNFYEKLFSRIPVEAYVKDVKD